MLLSCWPSNKISKVNILPGDKFGSIQPPLQAPLTPVVSSTPPISVLEDSTNKRKAKDETVKKSSPSVAIRPLPLSIQTSLLGPNGRTESEESKYNGKNSLTLTRYSE